MTVLLNRPYQGYLAGEVRKFDAPTESALIAQGFAVASAAALTTGAQTVQTIRNGYASIPIGASSVVVTHPECTDSSTVKASVAQAAADGTLLRVERVVPANGSFTIFGTANATAATVVQWELTVIPGSVRN